MRILKQLVLLCGNQALETFNYVADAADETTDIALFWADDPVPPLPLQATHGILLCR